MIVLLMRHADREKGRNDSELPLTPSGIKQVASVSRQLAQKLTDTALPNHVLVSPHRAAIETARLVMETLAILGEPLVEPTLDPDAYFRDPRPITAVVDKLQASNSRILIVGHQPLLGEVGRSWTGQRVSPMWAAVAGIDRSRGEAKLLWMLEPELSRDEH